MIIKDLNKQYLLSVPLAFVLQNKSIKEIENHFDDNGWNIFHHVIAEANIEKLKELIHFSFDQTINTRENFIPHDVYLNNEKKKEQKTFNPNKIPFTQNGFSAIHLALFLYNHYSSLDGFFYQTIAGKYQQILSLLLNEETPLEKFIDGAKYSLFDYAFLLENITLIDLIHMLDFSLSTLRNVQPETAKKILEVISIKKNDKKHEHLINLLDKKILNDQLQTNLNKKDKAKGYSLKV